LITLALVAAIAGPRIIEIPDPKAPYITVQAVVHIGTLDARSRALAQVLNDTLLDATEGYNHDKLLQYATLVGEPPRCTLSADHFRIQVEVPRGQSALAGDLSNEILRHARLDPEAVSDAVGHLTQQSISYWRETIEPWSLSFDRIKPKDVQEFYAKTFLPESTTIAVAGPFKPGEAKTELDRQLGDWTSPKVKGRDSAGEPPKSLSTHSFPITSCELHGSQYSSSDDSLPVQFLSATALGVGKWSTLHRVVREKMGLSYQQEAIISPTPLGFQTRLIIFTKPGEGDSRFAEQVKGALLSDVSSWTEQIRMRALGMAEAFLMKGSPISPLLVDSVVPVGDSLEDRTFMQAYWQDKAGTPWEPRKLLDQMSKIKLEELKRMAAEFVTGSSTRLITATR
jgi:predicted Zn-dependent peptidase